MDFQWVAIALGDVAWISLAFVLGFFVKGVGLPPLVGFLATGFALNYLGMASGDVLQKLADLGITLLLFSVGLKLDLKTLARPQVWSVTLLHVASLILLFGSIIFVFALLGAPLFSSLDFKLSLFVAFALSFSSTVFVVKSLEEKGQMKSLHGRIAIGILIMQDLAAVIFLAASAGKLPSAWAVLLFLLIPLRPVLHQILQKTGHGELLILYGLVLALGGAEIFELASVKDDLGALIMGVLISSHPKSKELAKSMLGFKDLFLVGFFLSIGMLGQLSLAAVIIGLLLVPFIIIKSALFFLLLTRFKLRARTSLLTTMSLSNYSEFGLIVVAIGVDSGWMQSEWLVIFAVALSFSFITAAALSNIENTIYNRFKPFWIKFQQPERLPDDRVLNTQGASIAVFGMGRVGSGAYDRMRETFGQTVVGVDSNPIQINKHQMAGRKALHGDPCDADFWEKIDKHNLKLVMLALPNLRANLKVLEQLKAASFTGKIAATAKHPDEEQTLLENGVTKVFNIYTEAGTGFADHIMAELKASEDGN